MSYDVQTQTALEVISRAMRLITVLGEDEVPTDAEATSGMLALNGFLQAISIERLMVYVLTNETFTWPGSTTSRTIGTGGQFNTTRPTDILAAYQRDSNTDTPVAIIDREIYDSITLKSSTGSVFTNSLFYDKTYPLGTLYLYPIPTASLSIYLTSTKPFTQMTALTTQLAFPPGYYDMVCFNLAVLLAPEFDKAPSAIVLNYAAKTKARLKSINMPSMVSRLDDAVASGLTRNILTG